MTANDTDLLRAFVRDQFQDAFTALVQRHLDCVYCAALRQVRSPQLAEEVAQFVFLDLARSATHLKRDTILSAWLYEVTRRITIDVVRREARRQVREQIAWKPNAMSVTDDNWGQVEPLLDEAMHSLDRTDRAAVLLRYFEKRVCVRWASDLERAKRQRFKNGQELLCVSLAATNAPGGRERIV